MGAFLERAWDHFWLWVDWHGRLATVALFLVSLGGAAVVRWCLAIWSGVSGQAIWIISILVFAVFLCTLTIAGSKLRPRVKETTERDDLKDGIEPQSAAPVPTLPERARELAKELTVFIEAHPRPKSDGITDLAEASRRNAPSVEAVHFGYAAHYHGRVEAMLNELASHGIYDVIDDWVINPQVQTDKNIRTNIVDRLYSLADRLEAKNRAEARPPSRNVDVRDWPGEWLDSESRFRKLETSGVFAQLFDGQWAIRRDRMDNNPSARDEVEAACELAGGRLANSPGIALSDTVRDQTDHWKRWLQFLKETQGLNRTFDNSEDGYIEGLARVSAIASTKCAA